MKEHVSSQKGDVTRHGTYAEEVQQEVTCVPTSYTVVHPNAVVVKTYDTPVADP